MLSFWDAAYPERCTANQTVITFSKRTICWVQMKLCLMHHSFSLTENMAGYFAAWNINQLHFLNISCVSFEFFSKTTNSPLQWAAFWIPLICAAYSIKLDSKHRITDSPVYLFVYLSGSVSQSFFFSHKTLFQIMKQNNHRCRTYLQHFY